MPSTISPATASFPTVFWRGTKGGEVHIGDDIQVVKLGDGTCSFTPAEALEEIEQARQEGTL